MTTLPLSHISVLDLTAHRAGPTAVRQLVDWGARRHQDRAAGRRRRRHRRRPSPLRLPEPASQQAQPDPQPEEPGRPCDLHGARQEGRRHRREFPARREASARGRLRDDAEDQPAHHLRQPLGLRRDRPVRGPARRRPDRAGHGRPDVDHRPARPGAGPRRHSDRRPDRRASCWPRPSSWRCTSASTPAEGQWVHTSLLRGADLHARLPGDALADRQGRGRRRPATTIRPAFRPASFPTSDGHINIAASGDKMFGRLSDAFGKPEL